MKFFLIAGEPSGDQHAARLMQALQRLDPDAEFAFLGGDAMEGVGGTAVIHTRDMAFMGFTQLIFKLGRIRKNFQVAKKALSDFHPDALILIDYPGFNLRMARWAFRKGYPVNYYIAPKVWAWNTSRVKKLKSFTHQVYSILPFETSFFEKHQVASVYVGNPVLEDIDNQVKRMSDSERIAKKTIALLPGSRKQEIEYILPEMLSVIGDFPEYRFVVAGMEGHRDLYQRLIPALENVELRYGQSREILNSSVAALVTSGTATLETALIGIPQLVCYKTTGLSYWIAKKVIRVPYISLPNLILEGPAVPELIQDYCSRNFLSEGLHHILPGGDAREDQLELTGRLRDRLGAFSASDRVASLIISSLRESAGHRKNS